MHISPSDGGGFCECDRCTALDVPGVMSYDGKAAVEKAERHLKAAEAKVPPGEFRDRVRFHRHGQDYTRVKEALGIDKPTALAKDKLRGE